MTFKKYLALPEEITAFERKFLARLNRIALVFFYLHIPVLMAVAWLSGTNMLNALGFSLTVLFGPTVAFRYLQNPRHISIVYGITAMLMGGLLVHFGQGPLQIEMHFYFFALLAMLCMFANPAVNLAAAVTVALHHLIVWLLFPRSVFNYDAHWWVVLVHAAFVVLETVASCYISREFFDNVVGLEKIVTARTATIREQQRDMRLILHNLQEGLLTVDLDGKICGETSTALGEWFGAAPAGEKFSVWMGQKDAGFGEWFELSLDTLKDGFLPREVALAQMPARIRVADRTYAVHYQMMTAEEDGVQETTVERRSAPREATQPPLDKVLLVITDITEAISRQAAERRQNDLLAVFQHMMNDKDGFAEFMEESEQTIGAINEIGNRESEQLARLVHTLKGNAAIFGMKAVSEVCHELENHIAEQGHGPTDEQLAELNSAWKLIRSDIMRLTGDRDGASIQIDSSEHQIILNALRSSVGLETLARMVESWRLEPTGKRLVRVEQQIRGLAERMGKSNLSVSIEPGDLRFNSEHFAPFWSAFVHVLRNAVDHGTDSPEERARLGKPQQASIKVSTKIEGESFVVAVEDDGPGVDWEALKAKATRLGIPAQSNENLLFGDGLSSRDSITAFSGRGVGLSAVAAACKAIGGSIEVQSRRGAGTSIRFVFPKDEGVYEGHSAVLKTAGLSA